MQSITISNKISHLSKSIHLWTGSIALLADHRIADSGMRNHKDLSGLWVQQLFLLMPLQNHHTLKVRGGGSRPAILLCLIFCFSSYFLLLFRSSGNQAHRTPESKWHGTIGRTTSYHCSWICANSEQDSWTLSVAFW